MGRKRNRKPYLEDVEILDFGAQGKAVSRVNDKVLFVPFGVPGDRVDVQVTEKRSQYMTGRIEKVHKYSELRIEPFCEHFFVCGGCKWQHVPYFRQLEFKQQQVIDQLQRIGKLKLPEISPILGSEKIRHYRNKMEYTFTNLRWITDYSKDMDFNDYNMNGLGFHMPGMFDRVLDINTCYLQEDLTNDIRNKVKETAEQYGFPFFHQKNKTGLLRNLLIRNNSKGQWMVVLVLKEKDMQAISTILDMVRENFPQVVSLMYIINDKVNDSLDDLQPELYAGQDYITEELEGLTYKIGPLSFFQTNTNQALKMYQKIREFASVTADHIVYDLYTGTGSIALFLAKELKKVVGIEYTEDAIKDAEVNKQWNNIENAEFFTGDIAEVLTHDFTEWQGKPDVVIADPPRAGMHKDVVKRLLEIAPGRIVYVSCNPATQARDAAMMSEQYGISQVQPVDMFPHTHHVENILLLEKKNEIL